MPFQGLKREINNVIIKFEETIEGLCTPLVNQMEGINSIDITELTEEQKKELETDKLIIDKEINKFLDDSEKLYHSVSKMLI